MSGLFGSPPPSHPALAFGTLGDRGVDYVALGGMPGAGLGSLAGGVAAGEGELELAVERTIGNCERLIAALEELDARILIDPRRPTPIAKRSHPVSLVSGEHRFDTVAGRIFLRDPDFLPGCPEYEELRREAVRRRLDEELELRMACMAHLALIADPLSAPEPAPETKARRSAA